MMNVELYKNCHKLVEEIAKNKHNTPRIRNKVQKELLKYLNSIEYFKDSDGIVVCDEANNSPDIIENNMLCATICKRLRNNHIGYLDIKV